MAKFHSPRLVKRKKKIFQLKLSLSVLVLVFGILLVSSLSQLHFLNIKKIIFEGNEFTKTSKLFDITEGEMKGKYFLLFSKRNFLLYPKKEIEEKILDEFPRIKSINFDLGLKEINIFVEERKPFALWCEKGIANCFLIDDNSYIFAKSLGDNYFRYYKELGEGDFLRKNVFEIEKFVNIKSFVKFINGLALNPYKLVYLESQSEIYFNDGSKIIFGNDQDVKEITNNLQSILDMEDFNLESVEYIDLRFGNKVFYK